MSALLDRDLTLLNAVVCHHGVKGQEWYKNKADRWQSHARYAMGKQKTEFVLPRRVLKKRSLSAARYKQHGDIHSGISRSQQKLIQEIMERSKAFSNVKTDTYMNSDMKNKMMSVFGDAIAKYRDLSEERRRRRSPTDKSTGLRIKTEPSSVQQDAVRVNPAYGDSTRGTKQNCMMCTIAYELRRRGYDVAAQTAGYGNHYRLCSWAFPDAKQMFPSKWEAKDTERRHREVINHLIKQGNGARGELFMNYKAFGHSVAYEVVNRDVLVVDAQDGTTYKNGRCLDGTSVFDGVVTCGVTRLDNVAFDPERVKEVVR